MNSAAPSTLAAIIIQVALGLAVFQANPRRRSNQCFLLLSLALGAWLTCVLLTFRTGSVVAAETYIRQASVFGALALVVFNLLRISITFPEETWRGMLRRSRLWLGAAGAVVLLCQTPFFLQRVQFERAADGVGLIPVPVYGPGSTIYILYFVAAGATVVASYVRDWKNATGRTRAELAFVLIGVGVILGSLLLAFVAGFFVDRSRLVWLMPFRIVLFSLVIAYGMATRKIMEVGVFLRRGLAYAVLTAYLLTIYALVIWLLRVALVPLISDVGNTVAHVAAALVVAFAMAPARGLSQRIADQLFIGSRALDFRATVSKAAAILRSVSTLRDLLDRFARTIREAVGTDTIVVLLASRQGFTQAYPEPNDTSSDASLTLANTDPLVKYLQERSEPLVLDELHRVRSTPELDAVLARMHALNVAVAISISARDRMDGIMLLGPRISGRIYGSVEQNALQVLSGQLAVAVENAQLFTEVQNAKIYNETLLQNLTTGVVAVDAEAQITVFNKEAEQITGLPRQEVIGRPVDELPDRLDGVLRQTLRTGEMQEHDEIALRFADRTVIVRASSSIFHSRDGEMLGALMVLTDITAVKRLESQIRRSDRLASLGTLSAGMAHEIKNPLVSIKTFTQLLPERYQDSDFRETFSSLIGHEIDRIDSLVNQLLRFARPAKPLLRPTHVQDVIEKSLLLVGHRLYQKEIKLSRLWKAELDTIRADADQLEQVFLNFFLNAMDAMKQGGELTVTTEILSPDEWLGGGPEQKNGDAPPEVLRITVRDNGEGIRSEDLSHVFDPFFTTKDYGTGLGLSVVHGIIEEHGGQIEVESELNKGTAFHILLPLVRFEEEVAAA
jgi:PAS domain S-box-containing protein